jgi:hypothetical protein
VLPARHTAAGLFLGRRLEVSTLQIPQGAAELAIADRIAPHEQRLEQLAEESSSFGRRERPGEIRNCVCLGVGE